MKDVTSFEHNDLGPEPSLWSAVWPSLLALLVVLAVIGAIELVSGATGC